MENHVDFEFSAPYYTLNELTEKTKTVWIVCHGFGQLARHFIRRFDVYDREENFIIGLQGLSRFYMDDYRKVGATWMTREDRETDIANQKRYFEAAISHALKGKSLNDFNVNLFGFSQGVAMISRMAAYAKINFKNLILWAGGFPPELTAVEFDYLDSEAKLTVVVGDQDQFVTIDEQFHELLKQVEVVVGLEVNLVSFNGRHEMSREVLISLVR